MKRLAAVLVVALGLTGLLAAQEARSPVTPAPETVSGKMMIDMAKDRVEAPLKAASPMIADKVDLGKSGLEWRMGLAAALNQGKPILLFQLLGNLDDVYC
jgi:hypothetical protein